VAHNPGDQICDRFELIRAESSGTGSPLFGAAWAALDQESGEVARVVLLGPELVPTAEGREALAKQLSGLCEGGQDDVLVPLSFAGCEGDHVVAAFEGLYVGICLADVIADLEVRDRMAELGQLIADVALGLAILHGRGFFHGSLGIDTIFVWERGNALWQHGLAQGCGGPELAVRIAECGQVVAPELAESGCASAAADVFAWAVVIATYVSALPPKEALEALRAGSVLASSGKLLEVLQRAVDPSPVRRYANGAALVRALQGAALIVVSGEEDGVDDDSLTALAEAGVDPVIVESLPAEVLAAKPKAAKPGGAKSAAAKPEPAEPTSSKAVKPESAKPAGVKPEPTSSKPVVAKPTTKSEPTSSKPAVVAKPAGVKPEPTSSKPVVAAKPTGAKSESTSSKPAVVAKPTGAGPKKPVRPPAKAQAKPTTSKPPVRRPRPPAPAKVVKPPALKLKTGSQSALTMPSRTPGATSASASGLTLPIAGSSSSSGVLASVPSTPSAPAIVQASPHAPALTQTPLPAVSEDSSPGLGDAVAAALGGLSGPIDELPPPYLPPIGEMHEPSGARPAAVVIKGGKSQEPDASKGKKVHVLEPSGRSAASDSSLQTSALVNMALAGGQVPSGEANLQEANLQEDSSRLADAVAAATATAPEEPAVEDPDASTSGGRDRRTHPLGWATEDIENHAVASEGSQSAESQTSEVGEGIAPGGSGASHDSAEARAIVAATTVGEQPGLEEKQQQDDSRSQLIFLALAAAVLVGYVLWGSQ